MAQNQKPVKVFRVGCVSASVFTRVVGDDQRVMHSVSLQKRYVENDEAKYTSSFGLAELPLAARALTIAQQYVERQEAEIDLD